VLFYLLRRVLYAVPIALSVGLVCFMLVHIAPGDPINAIVPPDAPMDVVNRITTGVRNLDYVEAARASGAGAGTIVRVHVLPNVLGPVFVYATGLISVSMILASGLSFLGLGTSPPQAEWGLMLNTLRTAIYTHPMIAMLPGICIFVTSTIFVTSICFNMVSDGLRAAMDVRG